MIDKNELAQISRELNIIESETEAAQAQNEHYKKSVAVMLRDNKEDINQFGIVRYRIKKSFWSRIMNWLDRLTNII